MAGGRSLKIALLHTIIVVLVTGLFLGVGFYLSSKSLSALRSKVAVLEDREKVMLDKRNQLTAVAKFIPFLIEDSILLSKMFPSNPGDRELLDFLTELGKESGMVVVEVKLSNPAEIVLEEGKVGKSELIKDLDETALFNFKSINIDIKLTGNFQSLLRFLESLKTNGRFIRIFSINGPSTAAAGEPTPGAFEWELKGDMMYFVSETSLAERFSEVVKNLEQVVALRFENGFASEEAGSTLTEKKVLMQGEQ